MKSKSVAITELDGRLGADGQGIADVKVTKNSKKDKAAICIPSEPIEVCHIVLLRSRKRREQEHLSGT